MALGTSVGVKENLMNGNVFIYPSPTNGLLNVNFASIPLNTKIWIHGSKINFTRLKNETC
jgi:hypothetical protein